MKQNICELDTMIFFREALEAHEFMLLPVMASAVVECRTADKELKTLNDYGRGGSSPPPRTKNHVDIARTGRRWRNW